MFNVYCTLSQTEKTSVNKDNFRFKWDLNLKVPGVPGLQSVLQMQQPCAAVEWLVIPCMSCILAISTTATAPGWMQCENMLEMLPPIQQWLLATSVGEHVKGR